jgi:hypothetical protein
MPISIFPAAVTSTSTASSITASTSKTMYEGRLTLDPAIYTITCASATITNVQFFSGIETLITSAVTASGTVAVNLATAADRVRLWTDTGSDIVVTITKTASALTNQFSGTLDTVTSTGTYTGTSTSGYGYAVLVGGGGAGGSIFSYQQTAGGGASGGVGGKYVALNGSMAVTIGAAGNPTDNTGNAGGSSSFGQMTANGGGGGGQQGANSNGGTVSGSDIFSNGGIGRGYGSGSATTEIFPFVKSGTTGGGGGGDGSGGGSGIGTGGSAGYNSSGGNASGYGAGGGGAGNQNSQGQRSGGNATPGVLYVLRF